MHAGLPTMGQSRPSQRPYRSLRLLDALTLTLNTLPTPWCRVFHVTGVWASASALALAETVYTVLRKKLLLTTWRVQMGFKERR